MSTDHARTPCRPTVKDTVSTDHARTPSTDRSPSSRRYRGLRESLSDGARVRRGRGAAGASQHPVDDEPTVSLDSYDSPTETPAAPAVAPPRRKRGRTLVSAVALVALAGGAGYGGSYLQDRQNDGGTTGVTSSSLDSGNATPTATGRWRSREGRRQGAAVGGADQRQGNQRERLRHRHHRQQRRPHPDQQPRGRGGCQGRDHHRRVQRRHQHRGRDRRPRPADRHRGHQGQGQDRAHARHAGRVGRSPGRPGGRRDRFAVRPREHRDARASCRR